MTTLADHIEHAADEVRAANHATFRAPLDVSEAYAVVGNLVDLAQRLPQLVSYLGRSIHRADAETYRDDHGTDPALTLLASHAALVDGLDDLDRLAGHLTHAHNHLGRLGRAHPEEQES